MKTYLVGGAIRDFLLGLHPMDRDYVVTNTTEEELISLGFQRVGLSFPVFLHPVTKEEYTLTSDLMENLKGRDLTINAMAMDQENKIIDPFHGQEDLKQKILRHVARENFIRDPIRVLRTARFLSSLPGFRLAPETKDMITHLSSVPLMRDVLPDRVWNEVHRCLTTRRPSLFFQALRDWNFLGPYFPEFHLSDEAWASSMNVLDEVCDLTEDLPIRFGALVHMLDEKQMRAFEKRLPIPNEWSEAAWVNIEHLSTFQKGNSLGPADVLDLFYQMDVFRRPHLMKGIMILNKVIHGPDAGEYLLGRLDKVKGISMKDLSPNLQGKEIGKAIREERLKKLESIYE